MAMGYTDRLSFDSVIPDAERVQRELSRSAEQLFGALHPSLTPRVYPIAVPKEPSGRLIVTPDHPEWLATASRLANKQFPRKKINATLVGLEQSEAATAFAEESVRSHHFGFTISQAIEQAVAHHGDDTYTYACSDGTFRRGYWIGTVLGLPSAALDWTDRFRTQLITDSNRKPGLVPAAVGRYLAMASRVLREAKEFDELPTTWPEEILREAGALLLAHASGIEYGAFHLFDALTTVAALPYEGKTCTARVHVGPEWKVRRSIEVELEGPIGTQSHRQFRKLAATAANVPLLTDGAQLLGFGEIPKELQPASVGFTGLSQWALSLGATQLMQVTAGLVRLPAHVLAPAEILARIHHVFPDAPHEASERLGELVDQLVSLRESGLLIITEQPQKFRNFKSSYALRPRALSAKRIRDLLRMDGAVVLDLDARLHAAGVILDGRACDAEDPSRGARFNSALRFVRDTPCLAVVLSEDGMVDLLPNLAPDEPSGER